jgi:hypothetical protein
MPLTEQETRLRQRARELMAQGHLPEHRERLYPPTVALSMLMMRR